MTAFQGHSSVKQFQLKILCAYPIKLKLCTIVDDVKEIENIPIFLIFAIFKGDKCPRLTTKVNFNVAFFSDTVIARSFKIGIIITLLGVYIFVVGLRTLILFHGHRFIRNINCKLSFLVTCLNSCLL